MKLSQLLDNNITVGAHPALDAGSHEETPHQVRGVENVRDVGYAIPDIEIGGMTADSRAVKPGDLFFAIKGKAGDGHDYIDAAVAAGAVAVVGEQPHVIASEARQSRATQLTSPGLPRRVAPRNDEGWEIPYLVSKNIRRDYALAAARFYPQKPAQIVVVTGTNGKTSTADFTRQLWEMNGLDAASIGTLGFVHGGKVVNVAADNTSPDPLITNQWLSEVKDAAVLEGSSIGLEQHRLDGLPVKAAGFTNFTRDHLDYHADMAGYFQAKTLLFTEVMERGVAVLNKDMAEFADLERLCEIKQHKIITFGSKNAHPGLDPGPPHGIPHQVRDVRRKTNGADLELLKSIPHNDGQELHLNIFGKKSVHKVSLVGMFQAENILCALGLVGIESLANISRLKSISGRMEQAAAGVYVDYAHTPDALENALKSLRPHASGKLILVFGCGGDRDSGKRPLMGEIAENLADVAIVTDDNPRTEAPELIREQILAKCPKAVEIADRKQAIQHAVGLMREGDVVLIAGKGHEKYQIYGREKQHFDDVEVVKGVAK